MMIHIEVPSAYKAPLHSIVFEESKHSLATQPILLVLRFYTIHQQEVQNS